MLAMSIEVTTGVMRTLAHALLHDDRAGGGIRYNARQAVQVPQSASSTMR